ncbi:MAG: MFS transporter [Devosia sp.]
MSTSAENVQALSGSPSTLRRARIAVTALFVAFGVNVGMWAAHIPVVKDRLAIDPATLGLALLAAAFGTIVSQPALGMLMARTGSRPAAMVFPALAAIGMGAVISSPSLPLLFVFCFLVGASWGGCNVAMNTQAGEVEAARSRPTMSSFHAGFSIGSLAGTALGGLLIGAGWGNGLGAAAVAAANVLVVLIAIPSLLASQPTPGGSVFVAPNRALIGLGVLAFLAFLVEGGMVDWSGVLLAVEKGANPAWAAAGFGCFTAMMALGRIVGNSAAERLGRRTLLIGGGTLIALGILVAVLSPWTLLSIAGLAIVGLGASNIVPILMSAAAQTPGMAPSVAIGSVATMLLAGFLVGPPLIGFVSNASSLNVGFGLLAIPGAVVVIAGFARSWPK